MNYEKSKMFGVCSIGLYGAMFIPWQAASRIREKIKGTCVHSCTHTCTCGVQIIRMKLKN